MKVSFFGVRGSCPCSSPAVMRYGGNTACVVLEAPGEPPLILDLGTGMRAFAGSQPTDGSFHGNALLTHMHWDHVQGLPFFPPIDREGAILDIYGPPSGDESLETLFGGFMHPPYFPITVGGLRGRVRFHDVTPGEFRVGGLAIQAGWIPHKGPALGYRIRNEACVVTYISDHQAPANLADFDATAMALCEGADLLIHDAQYTDEEFRERRDWGHCTVGYATDLAVAAGVTKLALFHHDPGHDDDRLDRLTEEARNRVAGRSSLEIFGAAEGMSVDLASLSRDPAASAH